MAVCSLEESPDGEKGSWMCCGRWPRSCVL